MWTALLLFCCWGSPSLATEGVYRTDPRGGRAKPKSTDPAARPFSRIIGGSDAPPGRYGYSVSLETRFGSHVCGGTLVESSIILSAAHCAESFTHVTIGRTNRTDKSGYYERFAVDKKVLHPLYSDDDFPYDFMLASFKGVSQFTPVRINRNQAIPTKETELIVMGFGVTVPGGKKASDILQVATVKYVPNRVCDKSSDPNFVYDSYRGKISSDMLCASESGQDSCQGDSGGPLVKRGSTPDQDVQVGLVSWGYGCALDAFPGVYARVSHEIEWMDEAVCALTNSLSTRFDCGVTPAPSPPSVVTPAPSPPLDMASVAVVTLVVQLDSKPFETGWLIEDSAGNVVREVRPGSYTQPGALMTEIVYLQPDEKHSLVVQDSAGNGFCCGSGSGYYKLFAGFPEEGNELVFGNGVFASEKVVDFTSPPLVSPPLPETTKPPASSPPRATPVPATEPPEPVVIDEIPVTVQLQLDSYPEEIGWRLERHSKDVTIVGGASPGTYLMPNATAVKTLMVEAGGLYKFVIFDLFQDGFCCQFGGNGYYQIFMGTTDTSDEDAVIISESADFEQGREHTFVAQGNGVVYPHPVSPTDHFLTLEIKFDSFPGEIGWILESESTAVTSQKELDTTGLVVVDYAMAGYYSENEAFKDVKEIIVIPEIPIGSSRFFVFTLTDSSSGLCCGFGSGYFSLYYGPRNENNLLVSSPISTGARESHVFTVEGNGSFVNNANSAASRLPVWLGAIAGTIACYLMV